MRAADDESPPGAALRRLARHAVLLALVLGALLAVTRPGAAYMSDEGAGVIQAEVISRTGGWIQPNDLRAIDPSATLQPPLRGDRGDKGLAPYAKHPSYPLLLFAGHGIAGDIGYYLVSILGTLLAAAGAALVARAVAPRVELLTLWTVGLATPLFFDSFIVLAHTVGAALATWAVVGALRVNAGRRGWTVVIAAGVAGAALFRSEGVLFGLALAIGILAAGGRSGFRAAALPAAVAAGAAALVRVVEPLVTASIVGGNAVASTPSTTASGYIDGRIEALKATWFTASYRAPRASDALLLGGTLALVIAGVAWRRRLAPSLVATLAGAGGVAYLARMAQGRPDAVPGLLVAFPLLAFGVWLIDGAAIERRGARIVVVTTAAFAAAVVLTEYHFGGGVEWGGRFFAIGVPAIVPILLGAVAGRVRATPRAAVVVLVAAALATAVSLDVVAVQALRAAHRQTRLADDATVAAARRVGRSAALGSADTRPVVVTTMQLYPQLVWGHYFRYRWLIPHRDRLAETVCRLQRLGVESFVLASPDPPGDLRRIGGAFVEVARPAPDGRAPAVVSLVMRRSPANTCSSGS